MFDKIFLKIDVVRRFLKIFQRSKTKFIHFLIPSFLSSLSLKPPPYHPSVPASRCHRCPAIPTIPSPQFFSLLNNFRIICVSFNLVFFSIWAIFNLLVYSILFVYLIVKERISSFYFTTLVWIEFFLIWLWIRYFELILKWF